MVSISEANHNFSKVARMVEENGKLVISKNNKPAYVISKYDPSAYRERLCGASCAKDFKRA